MSDIAIRVENLSKRYRLGVKEEKQDTLVGSVLAMLKRPGQNLQRLRRLTRFADNGADEKDAMWALKDVSFEVKQGEVVGVIGRNGAGKSTLLKILSRITYPTAGRVELHGRVSSLLEVGTGFHPELTGRENIYLNGAILGMRKAEIDRKFDEIVDFSGIEKFIDTPVKRYSSGMGVRLAFSVAAHLEPEILLVDEVLAVGDAEFQRKCLGKMEDVAMGGRTILFVSHNIAALRSLCQRGHVLQNGQSTYDGTISKAIDHYLHKDEQVYQSNCFDGRKDRQGNGNFRFRSVSFLNKDDRPVTMVSAGESLVLALEFEQKINNDLPAVIRLAFEDLQGQHLFMCLTRSSYSGVLRFPHKGIIKCIIPQLPLLPGRYKASLWCKINEIVEDQLEDAFYLDVVSGDFFGTGKLQPSDGGPLLVKHYWQLNGTN
ncbi:MAG: ABC transporter ATP-binding protein [Chitinophagaceae bacterium]